MSRSYKKTPVIKQEKVDKKIWNRTLRRKKLSYSLKGSQYKKVMANWNSWQYLWTIEDAINGYIPSKHFPTLQSYIEYWKKLCYRK